MNEKIKTFLFQLRIFMWYIATEPIRLLIEFWNSFKLFLGMFTKTLTYTYIFLVMIIIALVMKKRVVAGAFVLFLLLSIIFWEWERGFYMKRWRDYVKDSIHKKLKETGEDKNGLDRMDKI